jgi:hypothetical protein
MECILRIVYRSTEGCGNALMENLIATGSLDKLDSDTLKVAHTEAGIQHKQRFCKCYS